MLAKSHIAIGFIFFVLAACSGVDVTKYHHLKEPKISQLPDRKMLVVTIVGEPGIAAAKGIGTLYKFYYKLDGEDKVSGPLAPIGRWPKPADTPIDE